MTREYAICGLFTLLVGCSGPELEAGEALGSISAASTVVTPTAFIPMPVLVDEDLLPVQDPNGNPVVGWDGSTAELLAADSFAQCLLSSSFFESTLATYARGLDEFLFALRARMQQTVCHIGNESLYPVEGALGAEAIERWLIGRMTPGCNIDASSGVQAAIPLPDRDVSAYTSFTEDFADTWMSVLSHTISEPEQVFHKMSQAVSYSELNLCMAQRMQEQLNSASMLFASDDEQLELLGYIRERAQLAVIQYALLGKVLAVPGSNATTITNPNQLLPIFRAWGDAPWVHEELAVMGADFATAVRLDIEATNQFANLLRRQASARRDLANAGSRARADWDAYSPRVRLLNLLYGGDPLTASDTPAPGRGQGGAALRDLPFVEADMASPELGTLLGLARAANLLDFKYQLDSADPSIATGIDVSATASRLHDELERHLRQRRCDLEGESPCQAALSLPVNEDEYVLWTEHRVRLSHARELVRAFAEALGPSAAGSVARTDVATGYGFETSMFQLIGEHSTVEIEGTPWVHLDPEFDIRSLSPQALAVKFDPGRFLPADIDLSANQYQQGFVANRDVLFDGPGDLQQAPGGSWEELRALGTVPVLAFAREAILQGRRANAGPSHFFTGHDGSGGSNTVLALIERAIGISTVAVRPDLQAVDKTGSSCPSPYLGPSPCRVLEQRRDGNKLYYNVDYLTVLDDPYTKLASGNYQRDLEVAALDERFTSARGVSRADVDALPKVTATTLSYGSGDELRQRRRFSVTRQLPPGTPGVACNEFIEQLPNGNLKFGVTFPQPQFYVELFSRKNGVQNVAQNIVASQVANPDGTYSYSLTRSASSYATGNLVEARFYSYRAGHQGVFTPGPASSVWSSITYGSGACSPVVDGSATSEASITMLYGEQNEVTSYLPLVELPRRELGGHFLGLGSSLNDLAKDAWLFRADDWSSPVLDAFNLPLSWVPPADASLVGGLSGEESYQYYLRVAKAAAEDATLAVKTAIDTVSAEAVDATALANTDIRAERIGDLEQRALCGAAESCDVAMQDWQPALGNRCSEVPEGPGRDFCETLNTQLFQLIGVTRLPLVVVQETFKTTPDFSQFAGGELERILTAQWSAARKLDLAVRNQMDSAVAYGFDITHAEEARIAADTALTARVSAAQSQAALIGGQALGLRAEVTAVAARLEALQQQTDLQCCTGIDFSATCVDKTVSESCFLCAAPDRHTYTTCTYCGTGSPVCGLVDGVCSGFSFSGKNIGTSGTIANGGHDLTIRNIEGKSWSPGPLRQAEQQCRTLQSQLAVLQGTTAGDIAALNAQIAALDGDTGTSALDAAMFEEIAAYGAHGAAHAAAAGARPKATAQFDSQLTLVQQALAELLSAVGELSAANSRKDQAIARAELDADLASRDIETRFGLRRKFQSYDLWRARALLESARRMAVAARRAIEARFVVDLSALDASQVFVEAPSLWADEVYSTDLNAPAAVGLSRTPTIEGAVFPNKVIDYVGNLERFLQGYTVAYPTSVASPDTEVFAIPGPDMRVVGEVNGESIERLDPLSGGWQFSCGQDTSDWFSHPAAAEYPLSAQLSTACDGAGPVRARYSFNLDPWGGFQGNIARVDFDERHNVRWRRLAVNLVGTGVRDCLKATDPVACYADSFIRYDLAHAGPAWVTNHAQQWRAYELPTGQIEGAKALATEEWLDPIANGWTQANVANVARAELFGRPVSGSYELMLRLTPDVRLERIERIQVLTETDYWVRQD